MYLRSLLATLALAGPSCAPRPLPTITIPAPPAGDLGLASGDTAAPVPAASGPGCSWTGALITAHSASLPLCFAVNGACFARAASPFSGAVTLTMPAGETASVGAHVDLAADGIRLQVWTAGAEPVLIPSVPVVFGGVALSRGGRSLRVERVQGPSLDLVLLPPPGTTLLRGPLRAHASCDDFELGAPDVEPEQPMLAAMGREADTIFNAGLLPVRQAVPIAASAGGPAVVEVTVEDGEEAVVDILEDRGGWSRVLWWHAETIYQGWIDAALLKSRSVTPPQRWGFIGLLSQAAPPPSTGTVCPMALPLSADVAGTRAEVGVIEKGTRFDVHGQSEDAAIVRLHATSLELEDNAKWLVPAALLAHCNKQ